MNPKHREKIDVCCDRVVPRINLVKLWPKLLKYNVYDADDVNVPRWTKDLRNPEIIKDVYLTIKTRGPRAFENLLLSLRESEQGNLADILEDKDCCNNNFKHSHSHKTVLRANNCNIAKLESLNFQSDRDEDMFHYSMQHASKPLCIRVKKAQVFLDDPVYKNVQKYPMRSKPRGLVLLITNIEYKYSEQSRYSALHDETNLIKLFEEMGFQVVPHRDLTGKELKERVREFSKREDLRRVDSCFVIITSHGKCNSDDGSTEIQGVDYYPGREKEDDKITSMEVIDYFTAEACRHLRGKPKVFIFQSCRGKKTQQAVGEPRHTTDTFNFHDVDSKGARPFALPALRNNNTIRNYDDMLIVHATLPEHVAYRDSVTGSWFIQILCEVFMNHAHNTHLKDLFDMIDERLGLQRPGQTDECQTATIESRGFRKHCFLNPGLFEEPH